MHPLSGASGSRTCRHRSACGRDVLLTRVLHRVLPRSPRRAVPGDAAPMELNRDGSLVGVMSDAWLAKAIADRVIRSADDIPEVNIQPSSLDLRLGSTAYRL